MQAGADRTECLHFMCQDECGTAGPHQRRGANAAQLAAPQHRLQQVAGVHGALRPGQLVTCEVCTHCTTSQAWLQVCPEVLQCS